MPQYRGSSQFYNSPAGRALQNLIRPEEVEQSAGPGAGMRPGLRNAIANAEGESRLRGLRRREPTVFQREGNPDVPGIFGQPREEFYNPELDDPIAAAETMRQQARSNAYLDEDLAAQIEPTMSGRAEDLKDFQEHRATRRYYDPQNFGRMADEFSRKMRLATGPAQLAAGSRERVADITGQSRVAAVEAGRPSSDELALQNFDDWSRSGGFGIDPRTGRPLGGPEDVQRGATEAMRRMLQGGGGRASGPGPGGRGGGAPQERFSPADESLIDLGVADGFQREEVIAYLRGKGRIR